MNAQDHFWRSLNELAQDEEALRHARTEFLDTETADRLPEGFDRRRFLQIAGASAALASMTACRWEDEKILPYAARPDGSVPGEAVSYASALGLGGFALPVLVTSRDGRPNKIEGHPAHPLTATRSATKQKGKPGTGASNTLMQAAMLGFCDPDRSRDVMRKEAGERVRADWATWKAAVLAPMLPQPDAGDGTAPSGWLETTRGKGFVLLREQNSSPTYRRLEKAFLERYPEARVVAYEAVDRDEEIAGAALAFEGGPRLRTRYDLTKADRILSIDADLFDLHPEGLRHTREWARRRDPAGESKMNRLYAIEATFGTTGASADHRLPASVQRIDAMLRWLDTRLAGPAEASTKPLEGASEEETAFLSALADDLRQAGERAMVAVGRHLPRHLHALGHRINARLGAIGHTVLLSEENLPDCGAAGLAALTKSMEAGEVERLFILGGNPVYDAPGALNFAAALEKVEVSVHLSDRDDETSRLCGWHLPRAHALETWGDLESFDGTHCVQQPLIAPLYGGRSDIEVLLELLGSGTVKARDAVRETLGFGKVGAAVLDQKGFRRVVHAGFKEGSARRAVTPKASAAPVPALPAGEGMELVLRPDPKVYDGRFGNNAWLQELPEFMTKLTWGNALLVSPKDAETKGLTSGDIVKVAVGDAAVEVPTYVMPGHARSSLSLSLGYGRREAGVVGGSRSEEVEAVGADANPLRPAEGGSVVRGVTLTKTGRSIVLATTQDHHAIDKIGSEGREERLPWLIRETDLKHYEEHPDFAKHVVHHPELKSPFQEKSYEEGYQWGMTVDLNKCVGCNACTIACQSENNIPVVGIDDVRKGREMHWIRIDRYFHGESADNPTVAHQPVACQQCENAPCEQVCPVAATVHSAEGLNDMVYNRCVGTRYCSNNCPYKVRRFNWFNYHEKMKDPANESLEMVFNPEVTVRARGVMEKCTYCVQRISQARSDARNDKRAIRDGDVITACQQACPAEAITFGNLNDEESMVSKAQAGPRAYAMLSELNIKPRTLYLAGVSNPNPVLDTGEKGGHGASHHGEGEHK